jgi:carboxypeptidase T
MKLPLLFLAASALGAAVSTAESIESFESNYLVEIQAKNSVERSRVANYIHIDFVVEDYVFSVVNEHDLAKISHDPEIKLIGVEPIALENYDPSSTFLSKYYGIQDFPHEDAAFHNFEEMVTELKDIAADYPELASTFSIGQSLEGKELWGLKIGKPHTDEKPAIVYMATHHAREHVSTEMPILFARKFLEKSLSDPRIKNIIDNLDIYLIPMVNPDGAIHDISTGRYKWWRKNRRANRGGSYGVDLNRNYGFGWGTGGSSTDPTSDVYMGTAAFSEPETKAIRDFFLENRNIKMALSFHTFSELILYPWGGKKTGVGGKDEVAMKKMASDMAAMNHYKPMQSSELYIASGDTCDWVYGELKTFCFTFELSPASMWDGGFYPGASTIERVFDDNWEPMLYLAEKAIKPIKG